LSFEGSFPADAAELGDGGDPELTGGEPDDLAEGVFEDDLAILGGFCPGAFDGFAILENVGFAGADGRDAFVISVSHSVLLDHHGDDGARGDLFQLAAFGDSVGFGEIGGTFIDEVGVAALIAAGVGVGFGVVGVDGVVVDPVAEVNIDVIHEWGDITFGVFGAFGIGVFMGDVGGFARGEAGESLRIGGGVTVVGVELEEIGGRGEEIVPEAAGSLFAPHVGVVLVEVALTALADGGESFVGAAGVGDGAVEWGVPVEIIGAERADGADSARGRVLEDGGETGDACLGDCFKNNAGLSKSDLGAGTVGAAIRDLDAKCRASVEALVGDF